MNLEIVPATPPQDGIKAVDERPTVPSVTRHEESVAAFWNGSYSRFGRMWGRAPSHTATSLISLIRKGQPSVKDRIEIAEFGCGYGRDTFAFAKAGFDVLAVDIARQGLILADQDYRKMARFELSGCIRFTYGTIRTVAAATVGKFDGLSCHRTLHLIKKEGVLEFAEYASELVRSGGVISIGTRSPMDFDPATMAWVEGKERETAKYHDPSRSGQLLTLVDKTFLRSAFERNFEIHFSDGCEEERDGNGTTTKLIYMTGTRK